MRRRFMPLAVVMAAVLVVWYGAAMWLNFGQAQALADDGASTRDLLLATMALDRPLLPAPHQIAAELWNSIALQPVGSPKSLVFHAGVTAVSAGAGLLLAVAVGLSLAVGIVHVRALDRALMPWIVASQAVPVLAIAPMVIVVLGNVGITGVPPKALIVAFLSFFPIVTGMVQGLRSPDPMQRDLMRTYDARAVQTLAKLRWPASMAFLFPSLRVAAALALVGAIVAELPTGAQAGLGARLLTGSYYGQTLQIWAALAMAAALSLLATGAVAAAQAALVLRRGGRM